MISTRRSPEPWNKAGSLSPAENLFVLLTFQIIYQGQGQHENWTWTDLSNLLIVNSRINTSMIRAFSSSLYPSIIGENFQIYSLHITGKCICLPAPLICMIWSLVSCVEFIKELFLKKFVPYLPWNAFLKKDVHPYFTGKTLCHCPTGKSCDEVH